MRHDLHVVRERARAAAEEEKFEVQRALAARHKEENKNLDELQSIRALTASKERELAGLKEQLAQQQQRAREQRDALEGELEAQLAPMREGASVTLPPVTSPYRRYPPSIPVRVLSQRTAGSRSLSLPSA